ncbi:hypothetical protein HK102_012865 [Quaeritorhiza haematococci]|nr:hypothetical protein HK102_012865 [Quaeritorhiza haematococci]
MGEIIVFGSGEVGQLGLGEDVLEKVKPAIVRDLSDKEIVDIAVGGMHTIVLTKDGKLYSWGNNDQMVLGRTGDETIPLPVSGLDDHKIVKVTCSDSATIALTSTGTLFTWGTFRSAEGILGHSTGTDGQQIQAVPTLLEALQKERIVDIAAGSDHVLALDERGRVWSWGNGQQFQLGRRLIERRKIHGVKPERLGLKNVVKIGAGAFHSFAVDKDNTVYAWGLNNWGQCGIGADERGVPQDVIETPTEIEIPGLNGAKVIDIMGGEHHSVLLTDDGRIFSFGRGDASQLGHTKFHKPAPTENTPPATPLNRSPVKASDSEATAQSQDEFTAEPTPMDVDGTSTTAADTQQEQATTTGGNDGTHQRCITPTLIEMSNMRGKVIQISVGTNHNLALTELNPAAFSSPTTTTSSEDKQEEAAPVDPTQEGGVLYSWGFSANYALGQGGEEEETPQPKPVTLSGLLNKFAVLRCGAGGQHTVLLACRREELKSRRSAVGLQAGSGPVAEVGSTPVKKGEDGKVEEKVDETMTVTAEVKGGEDVEMGEAAAEEEPEKEEKDESKAGPAAEEVMEELGEKEKENVEVNAGKDVEAEKSMEVMPVEEGGQDVGAAGLVEAEKSKEEEVSPVEESGQDAGEGAPVEAEKSTEETQNTPATTEVEGEKSEQSTHTAMEVEKEGAAEKTAADSSMAVEKPSAEPEVTEGVAAAAEGESDAALAAETPQDHAKEDVAASVVEESGDMMEVEGVEQSKGNVSNAAVEDSSAEKDVEKTEREAQAKEDVAAPVVVEESAVEKEAEKAEGKEQAKGDVAAPAVVEESAAEKEAEKTEGETQAPVAAEQAQQGQIKEVEKNSEVKEDAEKIDAVEEKQEVVPVVTLDVASEEKRSEGSGSEVQETS